MAPGSGEAERTIAQSYVVPELRVVSIEHPCIVKNLDKGFKSLGGEQHLKHVIEHHVGDGLKKVSQQQTLMIEPVAGVSLHPGDSLAKRLPSTGIDTRNILVKVTLPKCTGRKRKRGSEEPFMESGASRSHSDSITASELLQRLRDNEANYTVEPVGMIRETHRFRGLPDFQFCSQDVPVMRELRDHALLPSYERLKHFHINVEPGSSDVASFPVAPVVTPNDQPYRYRYQQEPTVTFAFDEHGQPIAENHSRAPRRLQEWIPNDADEVPQMPPPELQQRRNAGVQVARCIEEIKKIIAERPIVTRRVLANLLPKYSEENIKEATQWAGYSFHAGPWRDTVIRFGVDPRKDPKYRFYQTIMFQIDRDILKGPNQSQQWARTMRYHPEAQAHIFDGEHITSNGKTWQLCDVTMPMLREKLESIEIRSECEIQQWGWFHAGGLSKVRVIMRDMMKYLFAGEPLPMDDYKTLLSLPEEHSERNRDFNIDRNANKHTNELVVAWGSMSKLGLASVIKRRLKGPVRRLGSEADASAGAEEAELMRDEDGGRDDTMERDDYMGDDGEADGQCYERP